MENKNQNPALCEIMNIFYGADESKYVRYRGENGRPIESAKLTTLNEIAESFPVGDFRQYSDKMIPRDFATFFQVSSYLTNGNTVKVKTFLFLTVLDAKNYWEEECKLEEEKEPLIVFGGNLARQYAYKNGEVRRIAFNMVNINYRDMQDPTAVYSFRCIEGTWTGGLQFVCQKKDLDKAKWELAGSENYALPELTYKSVGDIGYIIPVPFSLSDGTDESIYASFEFEVNLDDDSLEEYFYLERKRALAKIEEDLIDEEMVASKDGNDIIYSSDSGSEIRKVMDENGNVLGFLPIETSLIK